MDSGQQVRIFLGELSKTFLEMREILEIFLDRPPGASIL